MGDEPCEFHCNGCGDDLPAGSQCVAATCHHIFCTGCAQKIIEANEGCPLCEGIIAKSNVKLVTALQPSHKCKLMLCCQTPEVVVDAALTAINLYVEQQRLTAMYLNHNLQQKMENIQTQCKKKLMQMQVNFQELKQKCLQFVHEKNALAQDNQELQQKYAQKASQARKLQEMFKAVQLENEELKRHLGMRGSNTGGSGLGRSGIPPQKGVGSSGRHASPFGGGPTQMVTTVQHTKAMFDLSPASATGMHLLTGHGSAVVGPGNSAPRSGGPQFGGMFGNAAHGMGAASQRPNTAGGMFGPGAGMASGRNGGAGGGGGGGTGIRLQGNIAAFGSPAGGMSSF